MVLWCSPLSPLTGLAGLGPGRYQVLVPRTCWTWLISPQSSCPGGRLMSPKHSLSDQTLHSFNTSPARRWGCRWPVSTCPVSLPLCPAARVAPCVLTFVSFCASAPASPMALVAPPSLILFSADPSLKACSYITSS